EDVVAEEDAAEPGEERRVERKECRRLVRDAVAVLGDADEPLRVPARPDVEAVAEVVELGRVPPGAERRRLRLEPEVREHHGEPDAGSGPEEDLGHGARREPRLQPGPERHDGQSYAVGLWLIGISRRRRRTTRSRRCGRS